MHRPPNPYPTDRELDVLRGVARGETDAMIAAKLGTKPQTVKCQVLAVRERLGAANRVQLVTIALQRGLITLEECHV